MLIVVIYLWSLWVGNGTFRSSAHLHTREPKFQTETLITGNESSRMSDHCDRQPQINSYHEHHKITCQRLQMTSGRQQIRWYKI